MKTIQELMPTKKERERELALANKIISLIKKVSGRDAILVGSIAKNTCLRGDKDLDIFILFQKNTPRKKLEKEGLFIGRKVCKLLKARPVVHYAEHPYTRTILRGYDIDIVPCYKLEQGDKIMSAVDRSPLHTRYVQERIGNKNNEVRLLKYFMKRIGVYGAEIETRGFSGYLCELLVLKYGSFRKVLEAASKWKKHERIDIEGHSYLKFDEPLLVVDPVDPTRNVAAALSEQNLCQFILLAREYVKKNRIPGKARIMKKRGKIFSIEWRIKEEIEEIIWSQLQRFQAKAVRMLEDKEFDVIDSFIWTDSKKKAQLLLELEVWSLPKVNDHWGPSVYDKKHAEKFIKKYKRILVKGDKLVTEKLRDFYHAKDYLKEILKEVPSHLKGKRYKIFEDSKAKKMHVWKLYEEKFWKLH